MLNARKRNDNQKDVHKIERLEYLRKLSSTLLSSGSLIVRVSHKGVVIFHSALRRLTFFLISSDVTSSNFLFFFFCFVYVILSNFFQKFVWYYVIYSLKNVLRRRKPSVYEVMIESRLNARISTSFGVESCVRSKYHPRLVICWIARLVALESNIASDAISQRYFISYNSWLLHHTICLLLKLSSNSD